MDEAQVTQLIVEELDRRGLTAGLAGQVSQIQKRGAGSPENICTGDFVGQLYAREDGTAGTSLYVFEGAPGTKSGWAAK